ncbi:MAG TPA: hypothetical protein VFX25_34145, partial [Streptosporangiaceae bacterium]|nr:hypothetical protein [Streptosporangiaceae bacterium]
DPFEGLILALAARGEPAAAVRLVSAGLTYAGPAPVGSAAPADPAGSADPASAPARTPAFRADPGPGRVRQRSAWSAHELARAYRSPAPALMLPLAAAADDGDAGVDALSLLRELHAAGIPGVAEPAVADRVAAVADFRGQDRRADEALACLIDLGDPRAVPLLARDLRHRPFALDAAAEAAGGEFHSHPPRSPLAPAPVLLPCDPALLAAVREYLPVRDRRSKAPARLLALVSSWGPAAVAAIPEVLGLRPVYPLAVARVLAAVDPAHPELLPMVRPLAAAGPMGQRQNAASLLRDLTGADEPLLAVFEEGLREHGAELQWVAEAIARLGPAAASLAPAIAAALYPAASPRPKSGDSSWAQAHEDHARIQLALALAAVTGDAAPAIPVLAEILSPDPPDAGDTWVASAAADAAAVLGAPALSLVPALVPLLDDPACVPAAARALLRIDPGRLGGVPPARLADLLVTDVANTSSHNQQQAVDVLAGLGPARLPAGAVDRLRHLAERDQRLREAGFIDHIIRDDEKLRSGLRQLLSQLP